MCDLTAAEAIVISKTCEYALRALVHLAQEAGEGSLRASEIADELGVPHNYLSKTLHGLARAGVLRSVRGPRGGFRLARPPGQVTLADILGPIDPSLIEDKCLLGRPRCSEDGACAMHTRWIEVRAPLVKFFRETTLGDVADRESARLVAYGPG